MYLLILILSKVYFEVVWIKIVVEINWTSSYTQTRVVSDVEGLKIDTHASENIENWSLRTKQNLEYWINAFKCQN